MLFPQLTIAFVRVGIGMTIYTVINPAWLDTPGDSKFFWCWIAFTLMLTSYTIWAIKRSFGRTACC